MSIYPVLIYCIDIYMFMSVYNIYIYIYTHIYVHIGGQTCLAIPQFSLQPLAASSKEHLKRRRAIRRPSAGILGWPMRWPNQLFHAARMLRTLVRF